MNLIIPIRQPKTNVADIRISPLETCFDIRPPNSEIAEGKIGKLLKSEDEAAVEAGFKELGPSTGKALLADHLRKLKKKNR